MSDYFNNLVSRSFQPVSAMAPAQESLLLPSAESPPERRAYGHFDDPFARALEADPLNADQSAARVDLHTPRQVGSEGRFVRAEHPAVTDHDPMPSAAADVSTLPGTARPGIESASIVDVNPNSLRVGSSQRGVPSTPHAGTNGSSGSGNGASQIRPEWPGASSLAFPSPRQKAAASPGLDAPMIPTQVESPPLRVSGRRMEATPVTKAASSTLESPAQTPAVPREASDPNRTLPATIERSARRQIVGSTDGNTKASPLTALIPKPSPQPLLPALVKARFDQPINDGTPPEESASPDTVVNVTIGRIEVRATPAPQARTETRRNAPRLMSLDDYLRRRSGGAQ